MIITSKKVLERYDARPVEERRYFFLNTDVARAYYAEMLAKHPDRSATVALARERLAALAEAERAQRLENWRAEGKALGELA